MGNAKPIEIDERDSFLDELTPGTELLNGQYTIKEFLNSGGFGITYLATNSLDRKVVIKECFPSAFCNRSRAIVQARSKAHTQELRSVVELFVQEAHSLSKLNHPNIVGVHQVFEDNATAYMVLDFVEGRDLLDTLEDKNHGLTAPQIKGILKDVLGAVQFMHDQDILHRDISPDNILLDGDLRPVLIDFGAAREEATKRSRVLSAMRVVKDGYSPQEFYVQGSEQSPSSDLYALGATFYHLIAGEIPPNSQARLAAIASGDADPYEALVGRIKGYDTKFLMAIDKAMGILPKDRLQSAEEWLELMENGRTKSRVMTQALPKSSAAAETMAAEKRSKLVPLLGSVAALALIAVGALTATGKLSLSGEDAAATTAPAAVSASEDASAAAVVNTPTPAPVEPAVDTAAVTEPAAEAPATEVTASAVEAALAAAMAAQAQANATAEPVAEAPVVAEEAPVVAEDVIVEGMTAEEMIAAAAAAVTADVPAVQPTVEMLEVAAMPEFAPEVAADFTPFPIESIATSAAAPAPEAATAEAAPSVDLDDEATRLAALAQITPEPEPVAAQSAPVLDAAVTSTLRVSLPFSAQDGTNVIDETAIVAPIWVRPGVEVLAVNGVAIESISQIDAIVADQSLASGIETVALDFTVQDAATNTQTDHAWAVPVVYETALSNGTVFQTSMVNGAWETSVTAVSNPASELQLGDVVVAYVPTSETLDDQTTLRSILDRELAKGTQQFNFAVSRDGSVWVVTMTYADGA